MGFQIHGRCMGTLGLWAGLRSMWSLHGYSKAIAELKCCGFGPRSIIGRYSQSGSRQACWAKVGQDGWSMRILCEGVPWPPWKEVEAALQELKSSNAIAEPKSSTERSWPFPSYENIHSSQPMNDSDRGLGTMLASWSGNHLGERRK